MSLQVKCQECEFSLIFLVNFIMLIFFLFFKILYIYRLHVVSLPNFGSFSKLALLGGSLEVPSPRSSSVYMYLPVITSLYQSTQSTAGHRPLPIVAICSCSMFFVSILGPEFRYFATPSCHWSGPWSSWVFFIPVC